MIVLGIETSCDETGVALMGDGQLLACRLGSQIDLHAPYGGVVPEIAARAHQELLPRLVGETLAEAGLNYEQLDLIAATRGPGLIGGLLVGVTFAKTLAWSLQRPWVGVHHLHAHLETARLTEVPVEYPFVGLVVSGGHTLLAMAHGPGRYELLGSTLDDAAGEAYDKVAQLLNLPYPGGRPLEQAALEWTGELIDFPRPVLHRDDGTFSFSGLKTAVVQHVRRCQDENRIISVPQIAASFQAAVLDVLERKLFSLARQRGVRHVAVTGGVAANRTLAERIRQRAAHAGLHASIPPISLCTDNGIMIAALAPQVLELDGPTPLEADAIPDWPLDTLKIAC